MKLNYFPETDSLYIDLSEQTSVESRKISEGVVLDYDARDNLVGIDIDNASAKAEIHKLVVSKLPASGRPSLADSVLAGDSQRQVAPRRRIVRDRESSDARNQRV
jgi:uncharacterized protein YuzE